MPRRVADLVLLVAAAAVALRNDREAAVDYSSSWAEAVFNRFPPGARFPLALALRVESDLMAALIVLTLGLGFTALRHRAFTLSSRRWLGRGMAAIAVASLAILFGLVGVLVEVMADPTSPDSGLSSPRFLYSSLRNCQNAPKNAVLGAWSVLALAGRWYSAEEGLGRLGLLVGWCWLASIAADLFRTMLW